MNQTKSLKRVCNAQKLVKIIDFYIQTAGFKNSELSSCKNCAYPYPDADV